MNSSRNKNQRKKRAKNEQRNLDINTGNDGLAEPKLNEIQDALVNALCTADGDVSQVQILPKNNFPDVVVHSSCKKAGHKSNCDYGNNLAHTANNYCRHILKSGEHPHKVMPATATSNLLDMKSCSTTVDSPVNSPTMLLSPGKLITNLWLSPPMASSKQSSPDKLLNLCTLLSVNFERLTKQLKSHEESSQQNTEVVNLLKVNSAACIGTAMCQADQKSTATTADKADVPGIGNVQHFSAKSVSQGKQDNQSTGNDENVKMNHDEKTSGRRAQRELKKSQKKGGNTTKSEESIKMSTNLIEKAPEEGQNLKENNAMEINENTGTMIAKLLKEIDTGRQIVEKGLQSGRRAEQLVDSLKGSPANNNDSKSKAEVRRIRREKQETQRAAKAAEVMAIPPKTPSAQKVVITVQESKTQVKTKVLGKPKKILETTEVVPLLSHLSLTRSMDLSAVNSEKIHPAVRRLGLQMKERLIDGSMARVIATVVAFKHLFADYMTTESSDLCRDLGDVLQFNVEYLASCRQLAIAMNNLVLVLKYAIKIMKKPASDSAAKQHMQKTLDEFLEEHVELAAQGITSNALKLLQEEEVLLTYGFSDLVIQVIEQCLNCEDRHIKIRVVVTDSTVPATGGWHAVEKLMLLGVKVHYRLLTDLADVMPRVTKVIVEAEAVMINGAVQGLCGTAGLALAASNHNKPFIVLCPTFKFCNMDLTDALVVNELGNPHNIVENIAKGELNHLTLWNQSPNLHVVNLVYDVVPAALVTLLVTEHSALPTSAVPVIIKRNFSHIFDQD